MNQVFAKIRMKGNGNKYRKMLSTDQAMYRSPEELITSSHQYTPGAVLEAGEWFRISDFSQTAFSLDITAGDYETVDYDSLRREEYPQIDYLFIRIAGNIYFQHISKAKLVGRKHILGFGEEYRYVGEAPVLTINESPDAIYIPQENALYFRRIEAIAGIFKGISELYRAATEPEVAEFLQNDFIALSPGFDSGSVKIANRRRIAMAMDTLSQMQEEDKQQIFSYIRDYCPDLVTDHQTFRVSSEDNLKMVLFGIEQRFYTTPVGEEKRLANSVIAL